ncbi:MAG: D-alanine--D-alanine ligase [Deltaproteobacteria bacterium]|nr:D-alanine--D-alanine ligase [Deltaproteobacteria bacterium]
MIHKGLRVGVLMGGLSAERAVSLKSGKAVLEALAERGWDAVGIDVGRDLPQRLLAEGVQVAWVALHGRFGEDGAVQGLLEMMGIPYTGSDVRASAVAMDKIATKRAVQGAVVMAQDLVLRPGDTLPESFNFPAVVKPSVGGSTIGMSLVRTREELLVALDVAWKLNDEVLVEEYVSGDEITVAVLDGEALPVVRIVPDSGFFDFEAKYTKGRTRYEAPAALPAAVTQAAQTAAVRVWGALGCRGLARADFIVRSTDGVPVFLEINTIPGMTGTSLSPMAAGVVGVSFGELVERVLVSAHVMRPEV